MKTAVTCQGATLEDIVDQRFGRSRYFLIVDTDTMQFEAVENPSFAAGGGAGVQAAQLVADRGVQTVLTGNCGPKAYHALAAAGIEVVTGAGGTAREAVESLKAGRLKPSQGPNVASHFGVPPAAS